MSDQLSIVYTGTIIFVEIENWKHSNKIIFKCVNSTVGPVNSAWTVPFFLCILLMCDVTVHEQCLCPLHSAHMWCYCSCAEKKKCGFGNADPNPHII